MDFMDKQFESILDGLNIAIEEDTASDNAYAYVIRRIREIQAAEDHA
jgi:hypothetical protein